MKILMQPSTIAASMVLALLGFAVVAGPSLAAENRSSMEDADALVCKRYCAEMAGSSEEDAILKICPDGIIYRKTSMEQEQMIPWRNVERWRFYGPKVMGEDTDGNKISILRIEPSTAWGAFDNSPRLYNDLRFRICCNAEDGHEVWEEMNRYRGTRRF